MVSKFIFGATCACLAIASFNASASLISVDLNTSGDSLVTQDTDTGLEWLDLTQTTGLSYNYVSSQLGAGGLFEGWAYASTTQVSGFFDNAGGVGVYTGASISHNTVSPFIIDLWGSTRISSTFRLLEFFMGEPHPATNDLHLTARVVDQFDTGFLDSIDLDRGYFLNTFSRVDYGHALIRSVSTVPVPAAAWLFGSGLLGLVGMGMARRKKV